MSKKVEFEKLPMFEIKNDYKVSDETAAFLNCLERLTALCNDVVSATANVWGVAQVDSATDAFIEKHHELMDELWKLTNDSIKEQLLTLIERTGRI